MPPSSADLFTTGIKPENIVSWFDLENSTSGSIVDFNSNNVWTQGVSGVARGGSYGYIGTVDAVRIKRGVALYTGTSYKVPLTLK